MEVHGGCCFDKFSEENAVSCSGSSVGLSVLFDVNMGSQTTWYCQIIAGDVRVSDVMR